MDCNTLLRLWQVLYSHVFLLMYYIIGIMLMPMPRLWLNQLLQEGHQRGNGRRPSPFATLRCCVAVEGLGVDSTLV